MRISAKALAALLLVWLCMNSAVGGAAGTVIKKSEIDKKLAAIVNYERGMSREPLIAVEKLIRESQNQPEQRKYIELQLAASAGSFGLSVRLIRCLQSQNY
jgi:hypothetical protein